MENNDDDIYSVIRSPSFTQRPPKATPSTSFTRCDVIEDSLYSTVNDVIRGSPTTAKKDDVIEDSLYSTVNDVIKSSPKKVKTNDVIKAPDNVTSSPPPLYAVVNKKRNKLITSSNSDNDVTFDDMYSKLDIKMTSNDDVFTKTKSHYDVIFKNFQQPHLLTSSMTSSNVDLQVEGRKLNKFFESFFLLRKLLKL